MRWSLKASDRLSSVFEDVFLHAYPNPDRAGCPGNDVLRGLADKDLPINHPARMHIMRCSPCFQEFRAFEREINYRHRRVILALALAASIIAIAGITTAVIVLKHAKASPEIASIAHLKRNANLFDKPDVLRGDVQPRSEPIRLPPAPLELKVILPRFSRPGTYQIAICSDRSASTALVKAVGQAVANGPREIVTVMLDLSRLKPGSYWLSTKNDQNDASDYFPAQLVAGA